MITTQKLLDATKHKHSMPSDYRLSKEIGVTTASITQMRTKGVTLGPKNALKIADLMKISRGAVLAATNYERAKSIEEKETWEDVYKSLGGEQIDDLIEKILISAEGQKVNK